MLYRWAADLLASAHLAFVLFVVLGGFLVLRWPRMAWLHLPAVAWGACIELMGWICPLTPLENRLRLKAGMEGFEGGFIEHYLLPVLYPPDLTRTVQVLLGVGVLLLNGVLYGVALSRVRRRRQ